MIHSVSESAKIVKKIKLEPIEKVASKFGIKAKYLEPYGPYKAKISLDILSGAKSSGKYIYVTAITPTPLGEGKTVSTIGLSMALNRIGKKAVSCIRQPSLGPVFGVKGGATGGGFSQVLPAEDINLHFTGDSHAVSVAHNLLASYLDNSLFLGNPLDIKTDTICWDRVEEVNDRFLRNISIGMGSKADGITRRSSFEITAASEVMAILSLSESYQELRERLGRIIVAFTNKLRPVTAEDLKVAGAMAVLLRDALKPNIVQTAEGTPCLVHTGPFANISHGSNSIIADKIGLKLADYVVTETGFGADMGGEKFINIKCRKSGLTPNLAVLVASVRGLKVHSGDFEIKNSKSLDPLINRENISAVERGASNLDKQIENVKCHGVPVVVCINRFPHDTDKEIHALTRCALASGAAACVTSELWQKGSEGGVALAKTVVDIIKNTKPSFRFLYPTDLPIKEKIARIAKTIYGTKELVYSEDADEKIRLYTKLKIADVPVCMAKTHLSLSHDPKRKGRPRNFKLPINDVHLAQGAGYLYVTCGDIKTMPALPKHPNGAKFEIDKTGQVTGIF